MFRTVQLLLSLLRGPADRRQNSGERARRQMAIEQQRVERLRADRINYLPFGV